MICEKCKREVSEGARFCGYCGAPLVRQEQIKSVQTEPEEYAQEAGAGKKRHNKKLLVACLLVVGVLVVGIPVSMKNSFQKQFDEFCALEKVYALGGYETAYEDLIGEGNQLLQENEIFSMSDIKAQMEHMTEEIISLNEQNALDYEQEYEKFQALETSSVLGNYESEYASLKAQAEACDPSVDYILVDRLLGELCSLRVCIEEMNQQIKEYKLIYDEITEAVSLLYMSTSEENEYQAMLSQLESDLDQFDVDACKLASESLTAYVEEIRNANNKEVGNMSDETKAFDKQSLWDVESAIFEKYESKGDDLYSSGNYAKAYKNYQKCLKMIQCVERSWNYDVELEQVDISEFPKVKLYLSVMDFVNGTYVEDLSESGFTLMEANGDGSYEEKEILSAVRMDQAENLNIAMVADCSASMGNDFYYAQNVMESFVNSMQTNAGDMAALYSFSDYVNREMYFTSNKRLLEDAVYNMEMGNMTALYDGLAFALSEIVVTDGAKCVIAFTDGKENYSYSAKQFVINKALTYDIPIYLIGIGSDVDSSDLRDIAETTGGFYVNIASVSSMSDIYNQIYREQKSMYVVQYKTDKDVATDVVRSVYVNYTDSNYGMRMLDEYKPSNLKINGFIFYDSDRRYLSESELDELTEAEVRIALNEIYARRGYKFTAAEDMIQHFSMCSWYNGTETDMSKVAAKFNDYEKKNVDMLVSYECKHGLNGRIE